jgi:hypothetical protein
MGREVQPPPAEGGQEHRRVGWDDEMQQGCKVRFGAAR